MDGTWHPDPTGRHESRYWDGAQWTAWVSDAGRSGEDEVAWPAPPQQAGLGLRSGYLRYFRQGSGPWPIVDLAGEQVGFLVRSAFSLSGRSITVWDTTNTAWPTVKQSMAASRITYGEQEVGRILWQGVGSLGTVDISVQLAGRTRCMMRATRQDFAAGTGMVTDPGGTPLLSVAITSEQDMRILTLQRLVGLPDDYEYAVQALIPAIILELDNRRAFQVSNNDDAANPFLERGPWPQ